VLGRRYDEIDGETRECCPNAQSSSITDTEWIASGQLAGCTTGALART